MSLITAGLATICKEWNLQRSVFTFHRVDFGRPGSLTTWGDQPVTLSLLGCTFADLTTTTKQKRRFRALRSACHRMEPVSCPSPRAGRSQSVARCEIWGTVWGAPVCSSSLCMCTVDDLRRHPCPISHCTPCLSFLCRSHETKFRRPFR